eukprot:scaffold651756_cov27-Prasinocladus_malaysianus.AAC.1
MALSSSRSTGLRSAGPASLGSGIASGVGALAGGVVDGLVGVIREPMYGYSRGGGSGALGGVGRGLLG